MGVVSGKAVAVPQRRNSLLRALVLGAGGRLVSVCLLVAGIGLLSEMRKAPQWHVDLVEVIGCGLVPAEEVVAVSGLAGAWTVEIVPEEAEAAIRSVPGVIEASVRVSWPNRVSITVEEEQPTAVVRIAERDYWVSQRGHLVEPFGVVEGLPTLVIDGDLDHSGPLWRMALAGLPAMQARFPHESEFHYLAPGGYVIHSSRGYQVFLGNAEDLEEKLALLAALEREFVSWGFTPQFVDLATVQGAYYR